MNFLENIKIPTGELEILVTDAKTGELIKRDVGHNQIQNWAKHAFAYLSAGRLFSTWGNHGEPISDIGSSPFSVPHIADGTVNTMITNTPWTYTNAMTGLIQVRSYLSGDDNLTPSVSQSTPLYPFFPTKMRFGIGGLTADQIPKTDVSISATTLQNAISIFPFIEIDRTRNESPHIALSTTEALNVNHKVTFSCKMPGGSSGYPYNNYVISEAGLFCDAALLLPVSSDINMRTGMLLAFRTFYGIAKNESIDLQFNWSFRW